MPDVSISASAKISFTNIFIVVKSLFPDDAAHDFPTEFLFKFHVGAHT